MNTTIPEPEPTSTEPEPTSTEPEPTSTEPETTSTEPETTSTEPETTSTEPETTSTEPETTSTEPEPTSTEPEPPSTEPEPTSTEPEPTSTEPESTSTEPEPTIPEPNTITTLTNPAIIHSLEYENITTQIGDLLSSNKQAFISIFNNEAGSDYALDNLGNPVNNLQITSISLTDSYTDQNTNEIVKPDIKISFNTKGQFINIDDDDVFWYTISSMDFPNRRFTFSS